jgi:hypothetical protein
MALVCGGFCVPFSIFVLFYTLTYVALKSKGKIFRSRYKYVKKDDSIYNKTECGPMTQTTNALPSNGASLKSNFSSVRNKNRQKNIFSTRI